MNLREQYMSETGYSAIAEYESDLNFSSRYVAWLEAKVKASGKLVAKLQELSKSLSEYKLAVVTRGWLHDKLERLLAKHAEASEAKGEPT